MARSKIGPGPLLEPAPTFNFFGLFKNRPLISAIVLVGGLSWMAYNLPALYGQNAPTNKAAASPATKYKSDEELNLFQLTWDSKWWMLPIGIFSVIAVAVSVERFINLRRSCVIPEGLIAELGRLGDGISGFDPREAFRICQRYPSATANVIRAMLLKIGRPHSEVEHTVQEASQREAQRLYQNVRWLNCAAGVCPLLGLIGTVYGMIESFHKTTILLPGQDKANELAGGIYLALVTTLGGLAVAIPATVLSHYFEGRIINLFFQIDELVFNLLPQIERYEGRVRFSQSETTDTGANGANGESLPQAATSSKRK